MDDTRNNFEDELDAEETATDNSLLDDEDAELDEDEDDMDGFHPVDEEDSEF